MAIAVNPVESSFEVEKVVDQGRVNGKARHYVLVRFDQDKVAAFHCESPSLDVSFEMIEVFARQVKGKSNDPTQPDHPISDFNSYMDEVVGKNLYFALNENNATGDTQAISYQLNRYGIKLEDAFDPTKNPSFEYSKRISRSLQDELKRLAKAHSQVNPHPLPSTVRIDLQRTP